MYAIEVGFNQYSAEIRQADTIGQAHLALAEMITFHQANGSVIRETRLSVLCDTCSQGRVKRCVAPRRHSNGYHAERCYKRCPTCKGKYETILA